MLSTCNLVEASSQASPRCLRAIAGTGRPRAFLLALGPQRVQARMDLEHEFVEMHAAAFFSTGAREEEIHQHRLAAADVAEE